MTDLPVKHVLPKNMQSTNKEFLNKTAFHILLIAAIGFLAYSNTFSVPFQWDEEAFLGENPIIRNLDYFFHPSKAVGLPFYEAFVNRYVGYLTFAINYRLHAFSVAGFHVVNISMHLINAILVYCFVLVTFKSPFLRDSSLSGNAKSIALAASLFFVAHPLQTEAITYIFQRFVPLVTMFCLLSIVLYAHSRMSVNVRRKYLFYFLSVMSAVVAMKSKENAFTLPIVIAMYEFCFFTPPLALSPPELRNLRRLRLLYLAPLLLTLCIIPLTFTGMNKPLNQIVQQVATVNIGYPDTPRWPYLFTQFRVIVTYLRLLIFPVNQNLDYDYPLYSSFLIPQVELSFLFLLALFGLGVYLVLRAKDNAFAELRLVGFGILWFFITLSVESSIIPQPMLIDEYRAYLPSVGFFISVCPVLLILAGRIMIKGRMAILLFGLILAVLFGLTYMRNAVWCDSFTLWEDVAQKSPRNVRAFNNLGNGYLSINETDRAIAMFNRAISLLPSYALAYHNRGEAYIKKKNYDSALKDFVKADSMQKNYLTYIGMGKAYYGKGESDLALKNFIQALAIKPTSERAISGVAFYYAKTGQYDDAIRLYSKGLKLNPTNPDSYLNRGKVYMARKEYEKAASDFAAAVRLNPSDMDAIYNCAMGYYYSGRYDLAAREYSRAIALNSKSAPLYEGRGLSLYNQKDIIHAIEDFTRAIELSAESPFAYSNRGIAWSDMKKFDRAIADFTRAIELKNDFAWAYMNRGVAYKMAGSVDHALTDFNKALSLNPDNAVAYTNRGDLYAEQGKMAKAVSDYRKGCGLKDINACSRLQTDKKQRVMGEK
ncbi:MAG: tetratricopeptide repeat protein [Nitrospirae bacterium]|nr:tetratricopeptide repeat protein [Nitrospirota bacterium]